MEEDVTDEWIMESPPTHMGSSMEGVPFLQCEVERT